MWMSVPAAPAIKAFSTFLLLEQQLLKHSTWENALVRCFLEIFQVYQPQRLYNLLGGGEVLTEQLGVSASFRGARRPASALALPAAHPCCTVSTDTMRGRCHSA